MPISALPTPPSRSDSPQDFSDRADALLGALPGFVTEANALQSDVNAKEASVSSYATIATDKAAEAQGHATTASTKASEAAASAVAAAAAASNAEIAFDSFDDKYLGSKASDPATDNDGNPLLTGALYWNTSVGAVRVWNGSAWLSMAADASIVDFQQAGTGSVVRTAQDKLREWVSVKDFGAVGDGIADDTAEIQAAIDACYARGGGVVLLAKQHKISSQIQIKPNVKVLGGGSSICRIDTSQPSGVVFQFIRPSGYVPSLAIGAALIGVTIAGNSGVVGADLSECRACKLEDVEIANCAIGLAFNYKSTADALPFGGQSYFNTVTQCAFASCTVAVKMYGAANRNTFSTNTYTNCQVAFDFSSPGNVSETNLFINENVEGCHQFAEWPASEANIYSQTWVGLTVENPTTNGYVCGVKDPGRQNFLGLSIIPAATPSAVDFYSIFSESGKPVRSMLLGSKGSSGGFSYGHRFNEDVFALKKLRIRQSGSLAINQSISAGNYQTFAITVPGAQVGDSVAISFSVLYPTLIVTYAVTSSNTVALGLFNKEGGAVAVNCTAYASVLRSTEE